MQKIISTPFFITPRIYIPYFGSSSKKKQDRKKIQLSKNIPLKSCCFFFFLSVQDIFFLNDVEPQKCNAERAKQLSLFWVQKNTSLLLAANAVCFFGFPRFRYKKNGGEVFSFQTLYL